MSVDVASPRFSVVIPAYNEESMIGQCLDSLRAQDFDGSVELIVVDNNSTDATAEIAAAHGARVVREQRPGVVWARQTGFEAARGTYVITTDADTLFTPSWLSRIDAACREHPDAMLVAGPCSYVDGPNWVPMMERTVFGIVNRRHERTGKVIYVSATNLCFRRDRFDGYNTSLTQGGDEVDVLYQQRAKGKVVWLADNPTLTSGRRLERGFAYSVLVTFTYYYVLGYYLNRFTRRPMLGMAPAIRPNPNGSPHGTARDAAVGVGMAGAVAGLVTVRRSRKRAAAEREEFADRG